jgi:tRNA (cmo5U34)-methyltransferase
MTTEQQQTWANEPPGHHWKEADRVRDFAERMERRAEEREVQFSLLVRLLPFEPDAPIRILDIGAGYGAVAEAVLKQFPNANADLLDVSEAMVSLGKERLQAYEGHYRYILGDFADGRLPAEAAGPYQAIVSSLAIHHLPPDRKRSLYRDIAGRLAPGGWFCNIDLVAAPDGALQEQYDRAERLHRETRGDAPPTVQAITHRHSELQPLNDHLRWLAEAGFEHVDVFWKRLGYALYGGAVAGA